MVIVKVIWVMEVEIPKSFASSGSDGRYISVESGAMAVMMPRKTIRNTYAFLLIVPPEKIARLLRTISIIIYKVPAHG